MTKTYELMHFIKRAGARGCTFSEIQRFIVEGNGLDYDARNCRGRRIRRGYWCTQLLGGPHYHQGLLYTYCVKLPNGNWIMTEPMAAQFPLNKPTETWKYNQMVKTGKAIEYLNSHFTFSVQGLDGHGTDLQVTVNDKKPSCPKLW